MSLLTGTVFSFGTFSNNNAFKGVEICLNIPVNLTGAEQIISNITEISYLYRGNKIQFNGLLWRNPLYQMVYRFGGVTSEATVA